MRYLEGWVRQGHGQHVCGLRLNDLDLGLTTCCELGIGALPMWVHGDGEVANTGMVDNAC